MNNRVFTLAVLFLAYTAMALTGKVVDHAGAPLTGVTVQRVSDGSMVLTESDGRFTLTPNVPVGAQAVDRSPVRMRLQDGVLSFANAHVGAMSLRTLDVAGNEIASSSGMLEMEGEVQYRMFGSRPQSPGVYLVQYRIGSATGTLRVAVTKNGLATGSLSGSGRPSLRRGAAEQAVDSLSFSKAGYEKRRLPVTDDDQDMGTVVLDRDFGIPWNPTITYGTLTDARDGQTYRTVVIGTQTWMAQNLNYRNTTGSTDTVGQCYNNSADSCAKYGRLYTWAEVMQGTTSSALSPIVKGLCPTGWHIPNITELTTLTTAAGGYTTGGDHLKSTSGWNLYGASSGSGTDTYGFRALPAGAASDGYFKNVGSVGYWWSATESRSVTEDTATSARYLYMSYGLPNAYTTFVRKTLGYSARCLKD